MSDDPISNLTAVVSLTGTEEIAVMQSGDTKRATISQVLSGAGTAATESVAGIAEIASQAEAEALALDNKIITPLKLKNAVENGSFAGMNLTENLELAANKTVTVGGSPINIVQTATPVSFSAASTVTITVDFVTYSAYRLDVYLTANASGNMLLDASTNGGSSYVTSTYMQKRITGATVSDYGNAMVGGAAAIATFNISQPLTSSVTLATAVSGSSGSTAAQYGIISMASAAATNRIRLAPNSLTISGYYILTPVGKR